MEKSIEILRVLYETTSKHSNYQVLPEVLETIIKPGTLSVKSRFEKERLEYISSKVNFINKKVLDIGGNTGYFSFELAKLKAAHIDYYEGNKTHAAFTEYAAELVNLSNKITVHNSYFTFNNFLSRAYNVTLLLNVLHHIGDDYGDKELSVEHAKQMIVDHINYFADKTDILILQLGFCWKGNRDMPLFKKGTKQEMIDYVKAGSKNFWVIQETAVPEIINEKVIYKPVDKMNISRNDALGEYLNRPLFILKSIK